MNLAQIVVGGLIPAVLGPGCLDIFPRKEKSSFCDKFRDGRRKL